MSNRGRPPKLDGEKAREGARGIAPEVLTGKDLVEPPEGLTDLGKLAWNEAVATLLPAGVLARGDLMLLEAFARTWGRWKALELQIDALNERLGNASGGELVKTPNGYPQVSALRVSANMALKDAKDLARQFGLTPVARVATVGSAQGNLFPDLPAGKGAPKAASGGDVVAFPFGPRPVADEK